MKPLFLHVWNYSKEQFRWQLYLPIALFLFVIFSFNYSLDFEDQYIDTIRNYPGRALAYTAFLVFPFLFAAFCIATDEIRKEMASSSFSSASVTQIPPLARSLFMFIKARREEGRRTNIVRQIILSGVTSTSKTQNWASTV